MKFKLALLFSLFATTAAYAADIEVKEAWARASVAGQQASGAFMTLTSAKGATLVGISSPVASKAEIHEMSMSNDVMKMRAVPRLELPAGKAVSLSGDYHLMLMGLKKELKAGDKIPLTLLVEQAGKKEKVVLNVEVRSLSANKEPAETEHHHHH
ncbi:MAG TPA: copper chaperone PCu(A)C [Rhodocyclaceae bacterium]|jgi:copper(I)-binding protein|nr:copper chaperone PCu(A)C [Rhodocyclaceae bacterium]